MHSAPTRVNPPKYVEARLLEDGEVPQRKKRSGERTFR